MGHSAVGDTWHSLFWSYSGGPPRDRAPAVPPGPEEAGRRWTQRSARGGRERQWCRMRVAAQGLAQSRFLK